MTSLHVTYELFIIIFLSYELQSIVQAMYIKIFKIHWQDSAAVIIKLSDNLLLKYVLD